MLTLRKRASLNRKAESRLRFPGHRQWVRRFLCAVEGCNGLPIIAAHVRLGIPKEDKGGTGMKPHDRWCVPLCDAHHDEQHSIGEATFARKYGLDLIALAEQLQRASPHKRKWEDG